LRCRFSRVDLGIESFADNEELPRAGHAFEFPRGDTNGQAGEIFAASLAFADMYADSQLNSER
jgi:hypothetical protein